MKIAERVRLFDRVFKVLASFNDSPKGTELANKFMTENEGSGVLKVEDGTAYICDKADKGVPLPELQILLMDSARGVYIPANFATEVERDAVSGVRPELLDRLAREDGHKIDGYWDVWQEVLDNAIVTYKGWEYTLHQDGDLWLVASDLMTQEQQEEIFGAW